MSDCKPRPKPTDEQVEAGAALAVHAGEALREVFGRQPKKRGGLLTSFVERQHGTERHRNARKSRRTYRFSKDWRVHEAMTYLTMHSSNFCWPVRTLSDRDDAGRLRQRTPAMAAGLTWSIHEWLTLPAAQRM